MKRQLLIAILACGAAAAGAQTIYRCGNAYSQSPCPEGTSVQALRAPDAADVAAARKEAEREAKVADEMQKARLKEEARPVAAYIPKEEKAQPVDAHRPEIFVARAPGEKKKPAKKKKSA